MEKERLVVSVLDAQGRPQGDELVNGTTLNGFTVLRSDGEDIDAMLRRAEQAHGRPGAVHVHILQYRGA